MVGDEKVVCKHCGSTFSKVKGTGTSHMLRHIATTCKEISVEERGKILTSQRDELFDSSTFKFDPKLTRGLFTLLFIDVELPFSAIESRFWESAMRSLRPEYKAIDRQMVRDDCIDIFKTGRDIILAEIEHLVSRVSFTSDIWTSVTNLGYLCVTTYWIDKEFNFQKKIIAFKKIPYPHNGQAVASLIEQIWIDWRLDEKVFAITLDNSSVNDLAVKLLEKKLSEKMLFGANHMHMRCSAHILNLIVQEGMNSINEVLKNIRELLRHISSSGSRLQVLNSILNELNLPSKKGLILDCPTRWNSTFAMLREALDLKGALVSYGVTTTMKGLSEEEWKDVEDMAKFLEPFLDATKTFSNVRKPSSHTYINEVFAIRTLLLDEDINNNTLLGTLAIRMQRKFKKYWEDPNLILTISPFFDPRYKLVLLEFCFKDAYGDAYEVKINNIRALIQKFYEEYEKSSSRSSRVSSVGSSQMGSKVHGKRKLGEKFAQFKSESRNLHSTLTELEKYEKEELVEEDDEEHFDILQFWRKNSGLYPILAKMARDFLAVQTSSVASESAFSAAGRLTDHLRTSMNSETIESLVCVKDWFGPKDDSIGLNKYLPFIRRS